MSKVSQKAAVINTILSVLKERGSSYELGSTTAVSSVLTDADKTAIRSTLFTMFRNGEVECSEEASKKFSEDSELKTYISGLVNNWVRKSTDLNGGSKYQAKNPGSRQGSGDDQIKEMKKLLSATSDAEQKAMIQSAIDSRLGEIKASKNVVEIDSSKLPESLRHLVKSN
jgi:hypothetical protein